MSKPCKLWLGYVTRHGYGQTGVIEGKQRKAHRDAYCKAHGLTHAEIEGFVIRHKCDTPLCVEPEHLETGTQADNMEDRRVRGRAPKHEGHAMSKLSAADVARIRKAYVPYSQVHGCTALARQFGVSPSQVSRIIRGTRWSD